MVWFLCFLPLLPLTGDDLFVAAEDQLVHVGKLHARIPYHWTIAPFLKLCCYYTTGFTKKQDLICRNYFEAPDLYFHCCAKIIQSGTDMSLGTGESPPRPGTQTFI